MSKKLRVVLIIAFICVLLGIFLFYARLPRIAWSIRTNDSVEHIAAQGDVLLYLDGDVLFALRARNGSQLWQRNGVSRFFLAQGAIYAFDGNSFSLSALSLADGRELWRINDIPGVYEITATDNTIYCVSEGQDGLFLLALEARDGNDIWRNSISYKNASSCGILVGDDLLVLYEKKDVLHGQPGLAGLEASTGNVLWSSDFEITVPPIIVDHQVHFVDSMNNAIIALDARTGVPVSAAKEIISLDERSCDSLLDFDSLLLCACNDPEKIFALDRDTLELRWEHEVKGEVVPKTVSRSGGNIHFATEKSKNAYLVASYIWSIREVDGHPFWAMRTKWPTHSNIVFHEGLLFLATRGKGRRVYAYRAPLIRL